MEKEIEDFILKLTEDFGKSIPQEEKEREALIEAFKKYMYSSVKTLRESKSKFIRKDAEFIKLVLKRTANDLDEADIDSKKRELLKDEAFEEIRKTSLDIFDMAKNKMDGKEEKEKIDLELEAKKLKGLLEKVQEYNKEQAKQFVSEALIDSHYITSKSKDILSLRLHHYQEGKEIEKDR